MVWRFSRGKIATRELIVDRLVVMKMQKLSLSLYIYRPRGKESTNITKYPFSYFIYIYILRSSDKHIIGTNMFCLL